MWELAITCLLFAEPDEIAAGPPTEVACREVDDLARQYRIQTYNTFRTQRDVYDQWAAKGFEVLEFSRLLSPQAPQQAQLAQWFRSAAVATQSHQDLPETPHIDISQIAAKNKTNQPEIVSSDRDPFGPIAQEPASTEPSATAATDETETATQPVSTPSESSTDSQKQQSSLPWGEVGRVFFGSPEDATDEGVDQTAPTTTPASDD